MHFFRYTVWAAGVGQRPHGAAPASGPKEDTPGRDVDSVSGGGAAGVDGE